jgi:signal peptidase II
VTDAEREVVPARPVAEPATAAHPAPLLPGWVGAAIVAVVVATDVVTKRLALATLPPRNIPHEVFGEYLRFTLAFNPGVAFGFHLGGASRVIFSILTIVILGVLFHLYRTSPPDDRLRRVAIAMVGGGAIGNLIDRLRWDVGVVDFIDIGVGNIRFWTFNVADMAVSIGAVILIIVLQKEEGRAKEAARASNPAGAETT